MTFPNLARQGGPEDHPEVDDAIDAELKAAGITSKELTLDGVGEVPTTVKAAHVAGWRFVRRWYYWAAEAMRFEAEIDLNRAEAFHAVWGQECRVAGHCGCPSPREWWGKSGGKADSYHIDTQAALNAFVVLLKTGNVLGREPELEQSHA